MTIEHGFQELLNGFEGSAARNNLQWPVVCPYFYFSSRENTLRTHSVVLVCLVLTLIASPTRGFAQSLHSIEVTDLDRKADPCDDFFQFANGTWRANNPIPASMTRWSRRWQAGETSKDKLRDILEAVSADKNAPQGSTEQIIGDYYGACMDESRVNSRGMDPIKPLFAKIDAAKDMAALQAVMADLHD